MITITRRIEFDAGHRVLGHQGRCRHLHGHRYAAEVTVSAARLDDLGMVVDFGVVKELVGGWIDDNLDHNMILRRDDPLAELSFLQTQEEWDDPVGLFADRVPFVMDVNPTAENLAALIFFRAESLLPAGLRVVSVRVYETPSCYADCDGPSSGR